MQEYWVNVYKCPLSGNYFNSMRTTKEVCLIAAKYLLPKPLYRIHVKMKPPQVAGRFQRPCPLPKYERGPIEGWME